MKKLICLAVFFSCIWWTVFTQESIPDISVTDYHYHVVSDKNLPPAMEYPSASVAMDMTTVQGYIMDGRVHAHITLSDENSIVGGHLEPGTKALTFFIITIGVLPDELDIRSLDNYRL
jgi:hypothetical protein